MSGEVRAHNARLDAEDRSSATVKHNLSSAANILDGIQIGLDAVGLVPGLGEIADGINALIYTGRGDYLNAGLSLAAMVPIAGAAAIGGKYVNKIVKYHDVAKGGSSILSKGELLRIENAATRINKPITVVGSRASGKAGAYSDWDYVIDGLNNRDWTKIKNSLPGSKSTIDNTPRNIDIFKGPLDSTKPHIIINPRP